MPHSDCHDAMDRLLTLREAVTAALQSVRPICAIESVPLLDAEGRVLAADVLARLDVPLGDNSAMDGFAVYLSDLAQETVMRLLVVGRSLAGHPYSSTVPRGGERRRKSVSPICLRGVCSLGPLPKRDVYDP